MESIKYIINYLDIKCIETQPSYNNNICVLLCEDKYTTYILNHNFRQTKDLLDCFLYLLRIGKNIKWVDIK